MKVLLLLLALLPLTLLGQLTKTNFNRIDDRVLTIPFAAPDSLARQLTCSYKTDLEKVRSIFKWISENISYKLRSYPASPCTAVPIDDPADTGALKPLSERVAELVLQRKTAVCDGYARLFKTLCDYAGIRSELITGYADGSLGRSKFKSNHKWNAVYIDSSWYLLDATWASGYTNYSGDRFTKYFDEHYFLTPPSEFIRDHYPEELQWTFLPNPPVVREYRYSPFFTTAYYKNNITNYKPATGIIEASLGDTLRFEVETGTTEKNMWVVDTAYTDSAIIASQRWRKAVSTSVNPQKAVCNYAVTSVNTEWLNIVLNDEVIMRYKLNVRKNYTAAN